jgi:tetratricopeptide (TPR) repeat protein
VQQALDADPSNPAALYLRGVMLYSQQQIPAARKAFEAVNGLIIDHAPTLNNLAVVLWRQNQAIPALVYYDQGIAAAPVNRILLDNVAEALAALPDNQRKNAIAVKLFKHFTDQDTQLQSIMARSGMHRWGSSWVDGPTLDRLKAAEKEIKDKLEQLTTDINTARARIVEIGKTINDNNNSMQQMEANSYARDVNNNFIRLPLPGIYYTLQNENAKLDAERTAQEAKIQALFETGKRVKQQMPVPQFSGVQHLIGAEGAPLLSAGSAPPPADPVPTTRPAASRPSGTPVLIPLP